MRQRSAVLLCLVAWANVGGKQFLVPIFANEAIHSAFVLQARPPPARLPAPREHHVQGKIRPLFAPAGYARTSSAPRCATILQRPLCRRLPHRLLCTPASAAKVCATKCMGNASIQEPARTAVTRTLAMDRPTIASAMQGLSSGIRMLRLT